MAINRSSRRLSGAGGPAIHVPGGMLLGAAVAVVLLAATYIVASLNSLEATAPALNAPVPVASQAPPARVAAAPVVAANTTEFNTIVTRIEMNTAGVDSQAFILEQSGLTTRADATRARLSPPVVEERIGMPGGASTVSSTVPVGRVEILMPEVDSQAYILAQGGDALRYELVPTAE